MGTFVAEHELVNGRDTATAAGSVVALARTLTGSGEAVHTRALVAPPRPGVYTERGAPHVVASVSPRPTTWRGATSA